MKDFFIGTNDAGQRLDKFISKAVPKLPGTLMQKYIRLKRIKVNRKRAERDLRLAVGDLVELYINDEFFEDTPQDALYRTLMPKLTILYEDEHLLLLDKRPGVSVHEDERDVYKRQIQHGAIRAQCRKNRNLLASATCQPQNFLSAQIPKPFLRNDFCRC